MPDSNQSADTSAKLMLIALGFAWGLTWPAMRIALSEIPPFSMRVLSIGLGAAWLLGTVWLQGRPFGFARAVDWLHVLIASVLNIIGFTMLSAFALLMASTSRVTILAYTMPIWAALFAWLVLGERLDRARMIALALCFAGMAILIYPVAGNGIPFGLALAVAIGISWGAGTVYVKWARIQGDPVAVAAWQLTFGFLIVVIALPFAEGGLHLQHAHARALIATVFTGIVGSGVAYFLWFRIVGRLDATTAALGVLSVPVIGVMATAVILREYPTLPDVVGFVLIFAASACVLLPSKTETVPGAS